MKLCNQARNTMILCLGSTLASKPIMSRLGDPLPSVHVFQHKHKFTACTKLAPLY